MFRTVEGLTSYMRTGAHYARKDGKDDEKDDKGVWARQHTLLMKEARGIQLTRKKDSHHVKPWILVHLELNAPPKFKVKLIFSYKDHLTHHISEAVRIERRGVDILHSKAEYSRCRFPRLRIDMEDCKEK